jgi:hypothetical protein
MKFGPYTEGVTEMKAYRKTHIQKMREARALKQALRQSAPTTKKQGR